MVGNDLDVVEFGTGPVVALLHGCPSPVSDFGPLAEALGDRRRVWLVNAPGYGSTPEPSPDTNVLALCQSLLVSRIRDEGIRGLDIVGFSLGAFRAVSLALSGEVLIGRMVLIAPTAGLDEEERTGFGGWPRGSRTGLPCAVVRCEA